ncbi:MAG TPA: SCO1664 family protein, partial [Chloroflexota bacterium]|nr:SCO1664 family protein [Chloroflexota bacterium]
MDRRYRAARSKESDAPEIVVTVDPPGDFGAAESFLAEAEIFYCEPIEWGSNYSFAVALRRGGEQRLAIYKPRRGEVPLWDFPDGTLYKREYASYLVTQALGWHFIPPTVIREGPHGVGTIQWYIDHDARSRAETLVGTNRDELLRIALFDVVANNADRKSGHTLRGQDGRIWGIDHGLTFNVAPKLRTVIWDFCGDPLPDEVRAQMRGLLDDDPLRAALTARLNDLLDRDEVNVFF